MLKRIASTLNKQGFRRTPGFCAGMPALIRGPRLVAPDGAALGLVVAESRRATMFVSLLSECFSVAEFVSFFFLAISAGVFVSFCAATKCRTLVPFFPDSGGEGVFVAAPAVWTPE